MKLLSYGLLAVLGFSAWAASPQKPGTNLARQQNRHGKGRVMPGGKGRKIGKKQPKKQGRRVKNVSKKPSRKPKAVQRSGRLGQIKRGKKQGKQRNLIRNRKLGKPQRPRRNKATKKVREERRKAARNGRARNGRTLKKNGRTGQGYYQNDYYYYYDDPSQGAANPAATGFYYPDDYVNYPIVDGGSENCVPASTRIEYWDKPDEAMRAITGLTQEDAALLLKDVKALTYGNTSKFLMRNGGTVSYTSKSHSLIVNEVCPPSEEPVPYPYPTYSPYTYEGEEHVPDAGYDYTYEYGRSGKGGKKRSRKMANKKKD